MVFYLKTGLFRDLCLASTTWRLADVIWLLAAIEFHMLCGLTSLFSRVGQWCNLMVDGSLFGCPSDLGLGMFRWNREREDGYGQSYRLEFT